MDELEKLQELTGLFKSGALTDEEFSAAKAKLLGLSARTEADQSTNRSPKSGSPDVGAEETSRDLGPPADTPVIKDSPGWYPDALGRHEQRYWDGEQWTDHVVNGDRHSQDVGPSASPPPTQVNDQADSPQTGSDSPAANKSNALHSNTGIGQNSLKLERLGRYKNHKESLCLQCGYDGIMGVAGSAKNSVWLFTTPVMWLFWVPLTFVVGQIFGFLESLLTLAAMIIGDILTRRSWLHCPHCDEIVAQIK